MSRFATLLGFGRTASAGLSWTDLRATSLSIVKLGCYVHVFREYVLEYSVVSALALLQVLLLYSAGIPLHNPPIVCHAARMDPH